MLVCLQGASDRELSFGLSVESQRPLSLAAGRLALIRERRFDEAVTSGHFDIDFVLVPFSLLLSLCHFVK